MGPGNYSRVAEITSGRATTQQGLTATCKDRAHKEVSETREGFGLAHGLVGAMKEG